MEKSLIFEVGTEEVPARFIKDYAKELKEKVSSFIVSNRLSRTEHCELYYTPRRVIYIKDDVLTGQEDEIKEVYGPPVKVCFAPDGKPQKAFYSFLQKYGISESDSYRVQSEKGEIVAARIKIEGKKASELLKTALVEVLKTIRFKKSMRWGYNEVSFVRPIRWIVALLGDEIIPFEFAGVKSGRRSYGNYNVDNEGFDISGKEDFLKNLESKFVMYDPEKRKTTILSELKRIFQANKADEVVDESLLEEVVNILEYPVVIEGYFEDIYLDLPPELLEMVERHHQRYFPLRKGNRILPIFVSFANNPFGDKDIIRKGMEKVLRARLNDAVFFFNEDKKKGIREMAKSLNMVLYQRGLGNYDYKTQRILRLSEYISKCIDLEDDVIKDIKAAAELAKADLVSLSVGEFPELQGIMGKYFAQSSGFGENVALAIEEHYKPVLSGGAIPTSVPAKVISIADKIDHLAGLFLINQKPSASSDPFGARRAATGIIDIIRFAHFSQISTSELVKRALEGFDINEIKSCDSKVEINQKAFEEILDFIRVRIKTQLTEEIKPDVAEALLNSESGIDDIPSIFERKDALSRFLSDPDFEKFAVVYKRATNITREYNQYEVDRSLFEYDEERLLFEAVEKIRNEFYKNIEGRNYFTAMNILKENLYKPVFSFFDKVFVMAENERVRKNRLALLKNVVILFRKIIDLSYISSMQM